MHEDDKKAKFHVFFAVSFSGIVQITLYKSSCRWLDKNGFVPAHPPPSRQHLLQRGL